MYKYQLGIDDSCVYSNAAGSTTINLTNAPSYLSGNVIYPWAFAVNSNTWHFINLDSVTLSTITVSPALTVESSSLVISYNGPTAGTVPTGSITSSAGAVVYGSGTDGNAHAIAATQLSSGQWALATDTEMILSGDIVVSNVQVYSRDGTSASLGYGRISNQDALFVTSSYSYPVYTSIMSGAYAASVDSVNDLHVYDTRVSGSIITGSIIISGSVKANSDLVVSTAALISGSIVANTNVTVAAEALVSGSVKTNSDVTVATSALISGSIVANTNATLASETLLSQSIVANTNATVAAEALVSSSIVAGFSASLDFDKLNLLYQMYPYQLGVDEGSYGNDASDSVIDVFGTTGITGSTICPWIFNTTNLTWHQVTLGTVTTSSITVSPVIGTATASLVIRFNKSKKGYSSADDAYQVKVVNPDYAHQNGPTTLITESNGAMGLTTSSYIPIPTYSRFIIQFSRMNGVTASLSATISTDATPSVVDYYPITEELYGSSLINGDCYLVQEKPFKATQLKLDYYKTNATNTCLVRYWLFD
jgi:cytoskeletal protein CcmA (bactofilin family)